MRKLLSANFARLWKEKMFWFAFTFMSLGSAAFGWMSYHTALKNTGSQLYAEDMMFNMSPMMGLVFAFFISMRIGTEFDEHTVRNKFIVGYNHTQVYFAEYVTCWVASLVLFSVMILCSTVSGYLIFGSFRLPWKDIAYLLLCGILMTSTFSAMCVGLCMNVRSKSTSLVASLIFLFAIILLASFCITALEQEPTMYSYINVTMEGIAYGEVVENPDYIDGFQRTVYELIADLLPSGQAIQLNNLQYERAKSWPLLSVIMLLFTTIAGYLSFRKRDIQ